MKKCHFHFCTWAHQSVFYVLWPVLDDSPRWTPRWSCPRNILIDPLATWMRRVCSSPWSPSTSASSPWCLLRRMRLPERGPTSSTRFNFVLWHIKESHFAFVYFFCVQVKILPLHLSKGTPESQYVEWPLDDIFKYESKMIVLFVFLYIAAGRRFIKQRCGRL